MLSHPFYMNQDELISFGASTAALTVIYVLGGMLLQPMGCRRSPTGEDDAASRERQRGWILSGVTGIAMTLGGSVQVYEIARLFLAVGASRDDWNAFLQESPWYMQMVIAAFMAHCVADMILGTLFYPKAMDVVSGYIHHAAYLYVSVYALRVCPRVLGLFFIEELPTVLLAAGNWDHRLRWDQGFGMTFAVLRIGVHICSSALVIWARPEVYIGIGVMVLSFSVHCMWMNTWCRRYGPCKRSKRSKKGE